MSLLDELRADQGKPTQCAVCRYLEGIKKSECAEWDLAMADRSFTSASIHRALQARQAPVGRSSVESHRANRHRPAS